MSTKCSALLGPNAKSARADLGVDADAAAHLVDTYGARWRQVLAADPRPEGRQRIHPAHPHLLCELTWAVRHEDATTLGDVLLRRWTLGLAHDGAPEAARPVLDRMAELLGWSPDERERQWTSYLGEAAHFAIPQVRVPVVGSGPAARGRPQRRSNPAPKAPTSSARSEP